MILQTSTTDKLQIITTSTADIKVHVSWLTNASGTITPDRKNTSSTSVATTDITLVPGSSEQDSIVHINVRNVHASSSNTVTIQHTDGTTIIILYKTTLLAGESVIYMEGVGWRVYDANGQPKVGQLAVTPSTNDFRLSGVSATPVMTADSTSLSNIFLTQYKGNSIALNDGTNWQLVQPPSEVSIAVTARTTDLPFDVFGVINVGGGAPMFLELLDWTNSTTRATGLTRVDGVWTKSGDPSRRYLGSCRPRSATTFHWVLSGTDAPVKMDLFNADNRVDVNFQLQGSATATYNYTLATVRQAQASTNYQVDVMVGLQEQYWEGVLHSTSKNSTISIARAAGIGFDSTTTFSGQISYTYNTVLSVNSHGISSFTNQPAIGRHFYSWNEVSLATGTCTWINKDTTVGQNIQSGIRGSWTC